MQYQCLKRDFFWKCRQAIKAIKAMPCAWCPVPSTSRRSPRPCTGKEIYSFLFGISLELCSWLAVVSNHGFTKKAKRGLRSKQSCPPFFGSWLTSLDRYLDIRSLKFRDSPSASTIAWWILSESPLCWYLDVSKSTVACCYYCICSPSRCSTGNIRFLPPSPFSDLCPPSPTLSDCVQWLQARNSLIPPMEPGDFHWKNSTIHGISNDHETWGEKNTVLTLRWWDDVQKICFWWGEREVIQL